MHFVVFSVDDAEVIQCCGKRSGHVLTPMFFLDVAGGVMVFVK